MENNGAEGHKGDTDSEITDNSKEPQDRNTDSATAFPGSGSGINLNKDTGASDTGSGSAPGAAPENPCDRELFFEKHISLFNLIVFSPLIVTVLYFVFKVLVYIICAAGLGTSGKGFVAFLNGLFVFAGLTALHLLIAWLIGRDAKRSNSPLKNSFFARPVPRYIIFSPVIWILSWFYVMAYGISKIARTGPVRFYRISITKAFPIIITIVSYVVFFAVDAVEMPKGKKSASCFSAQECVKKGDSFTDRFQNCNLSLPLYERACDKYDSAEGCYNAATCYAFDPHAFDKSNARKYYGRACDKGHSPACVYRKMTK